MKTRRRICRLFTWLLSLALLLTSMPFALADEAHTLEATPSEPIAPVPGITLPEEDVPEEEMPEADVPDEDVPEEDVPEEDIPVVDLPLVDIPDAETVDNEIDTLLPDSAVQIDADTECEHQWQYTEDGISTCSICRISCSHSWKNDGDNRKYRYCENCGYYCKHPSDHTHVEDQLGGASFFAENKRYEKIDELFHWYVYDRVGKDTCDICGKVLMIQSLRKIFQKWSFTILKMAFATGAIMYRQLNASTL